MTLDIQLKSFWLKSENLKQNMDMIPKSGKTKVQKGELELKIEYHLFRCKVNLKNKDHHEKELKRYASLYYETTGNYYKAKSKGDYKK